MAYYAYIGADELGQERLGTSGRLIMRDVKTANGAYKRCLRFFGDKPFRLYWFTNFYDDKTFREIKLY